MSVARHTSKCTRLSSLTRLPSVRSCSSQTRSFQSSAARLADASTFPDARDVQAKVASALFSVSEHSTADPHSFYDSVAPDDAKEFSDVLASVVPMLEAYVHDSQSNPDAHALPSLEAGEVDTLLSVGDLHRASAKPKDVAGMAREVAAILSTSARTQRPEYMFKLSTGSDSPGRLAALVNGVLNNNVHTFKTSPALSTIEKHVSQELCRVYYGGYDRDILSEQNGFDDFVKHTGAVFVPGGTYTVFKALRIARDKAFPGVLRDGWSAVEGKPTIFCSDQMHYSVTLGAQTIGIGANDGLTKIRTKLDGSMDLDHLFESVKMARSKDNDLNPFLVSCMAGTTVVGGFDDFNEIAEICRLHGLQMHVDGCWGGSIAFSGDRASRGKMDGAQHADFIGFDAHKLLSMPLLCSAFLARDGADLARSCTPTGADYIFHEADITQSPDLGPRTLQCGRAPDALKLYLSWLAYGRAGLAARVDHCVGMAATLHRLIESNSDFVALHKAGVPYANVCFWHVGKGSGCEHIKEDLLRWRDSEYSAQYEPQQCASLAEMRALLKQSTERTQSAMTQAGLWAIDYAPLPQLGIPHFFRAVTGNFRITQKHLEHLLATVCETAAKLEAEERRA